jgi:hypothetical protein
MLLESVFEISARRRQAMHRNRLTAFSNRGYAFFRVLALDAGI